MAVETPTAGALLRAARDRLRAAGVSNPVFEARFLVASLSGLDATDFVVRPDLPVASMVNASVEDALRRRENGEPLHRILGWREFYGLRLALSPDTLEPRPDSETLVEAVLPFAREWAAQHNACRILDLGTGTGALALALLSQVEGAEAVAVDIADGALRTATINARDLGLQGRFRPLRSDWFSDVSGRFALILSNPPYISHEELGLLDPSVSRFDPARALDGGADGLDAYRILAAESAVYLEEGGRVAVEIGCSQRVAVTGLFEQRGFALHTEHRDLGGNDRVLVFIPRENAAKR